MKDMNLLSKKQSGGFMTAVKSLGNDKVRLLTRVMFPSSQSSHVYIISTSGYTYTCTVHNTSVEDSIE